MLWHQLVGMRKPGVGVKSNFHLTKMNQNELFAIFLLLFIENMVYYFGKGH